jgi:hypothetical protein
MTKLKLWNIIARIFRVMGEDNNVEDIGFKKDNYERHEFVVNGYLFEVRMIDEPKK